MRFKNTSPENTLNLGMLGLGTVAPGEEIDVPEEVYRPGRTSAGARAPSTLEQCAPQMRPVNPEEEAAWLEVPGVPPKVSRFRGVGHGTVDVKTLPPGVQAAVAAAQAPASPPPGVPAPKPAKKAKSDPPPAAPVPAPPPVPPVQE